MIRAVTLVVIVVIFNSSSCKQDGYVSGAQEDERKIFDYKKAFIISFRFEGKIDEKKFCKECNFNQYQLILKLESEKSDSIQLSYQYYQPFYFYKEKRLHLSVNKYLYNAVEAGQIIAKDRNSHYVHINDREMLLVSKEKLKWLP